MNQHGQYRSPVKFLTAPSTQFRNLTALCFLACIFFSRLGCGTVITNCTDADLRTAVMNGGSISFACDGTIPLTNEIVISHDSVLDATGHQIAISGMGSNRLFTINSGSTLTIMHVVLENGLATATNGTLAGPDGAGAGGAILNQRGTLNAVDCLLESNVAIGRAGVFIAFGSPVIPAGPGMGGAIAAFGGSVRLTNTVFSANTTIGGRGYDAYYAGSSGGTGGTSYGGAIYSEGTDVMADNCNFCTNSSISGSGGSAHFPGAAGNAFGGAVLSTGGGLVFVNSTIYSNSASAPSAGGAGGGGAYVTGGSLQAINCTFATNSVTGGPAIYVLQNEIWAPGNGLGGALWLSVPSNNINACSFIANLASGGTNGNSLIGVGVGMGGAVYNEQLLAVSNCTLFGNIAQSGGASGHGGAIYNQTGTGLLTHVTVVSNAAQVWASSTPAAVEGSGGPLTLQNCILAFSTAGGFSCANGYGPLVDGGGNISSDSTPAFTDPTSHNNVNPLLGMLGAYGGPTPTVPLLPGSPAIDAGNPAACGTFDQRGYPRPYGTGCDIGAFEFWPSNSVFGRITGYVSARGDITVSAGTISSTVRPDGVYGLAGLPSGASTIIPRCADVVFVPGSLLVTVPPESTGVDFYAYRSNALMLVTGPSNILTLRFAGQPGTSYSLLESTNLETWIPCSTNTTTAKGLVDFLQTNQPGWSGRFFRTKGL